MTAARLRRSSRPCCRESPTADEALAAETALLLHPASGPAVPAPTRHAETGATGRRRERPRILLVDDDVRNLFALASLLEDRGLEVVFSETGAEALEILGSNQTIDLVLMDIMMPQMDGYETIRAARQMPAAARAADHRRDGQGDAGRPGEEHRSRAPPTTSPSRSTRPS